MNKIKSCFYAMRFIIKFIIKLPLLKWVKSELIKEIEKQKELIYFKIINSETHEVMVVCPFCGVGSAIKIQGQIYQRYHVCVNCNSRKFYDLDYKKL